MPFHVKNTNKQDKLMEREKKKRQFVSVCLPLYTFVWIPPSLITNSKSSTLNYIHPYKHHICSALNFYPTRNKKDKMTPTWSSEHNGNRAHIGDTFSSWQKSVPPLCFTLSSSIPHHWPAHQLQNTPATSKAFYQNDMGHKTT